MKYFYNKSREIVTNSLSFLLSTLLISSNSRISLKLLTYQLWTKWTEGILSRFCGKRLISCIMLARRTGISLRRNSNDRTSFALRPTFSKNERDKQNIKPDTKILNVELFIFVLGLPYVQVTMTCWAHVQKKQKQKWQIDTTRFYLKTCCCLPARYFSTWFKTTYKAFPIIRNLSTRVNKQTNKSAVWPSR